MVLVIGEKIMKRLVEIIDPQPKLNGNSSDKRRLSMGIFQLLFQGIIHFGESYEYNNIVLIWRENHKKSSNIGKSLNFIINTLYSGNYCKF